MENGKEYLGTDLLKVPILHISLGKDLQPKYHLTIDVYRPLNTDCMFSIAEDMPTVVKITKGDVGQEMTTIIDMYLLYPDIFLINDNSSKCLIHERAMSDSIGDGGIIARDCDLTELFAHRNDLLKLLDSANGHTDELRNLRQMLESKDN